MNRLIKLGIIATVALITVSCKKKDLNEGGMPKNIAASSNFTCGTLDAQFGGSPTTSIDLSLGLPLEFAATFNETVSWKIVLRGQTSTAVKTISGTSSVLNASNATWIGNHDELYFFESGEKVSADLIVSGKAGICSSDTVTIVNARNFRVVTPTFMLINGAATSNNSDFEPTNNSSYASTFPTLFNIGGETKAILQADTLRAPEGQYLLRIIGKSTEQNGFFVGGLQSRRNSAASTYFFPTSWTDPDKIYLNVYVRGINGMPFDKDGNQAKPFATLNFECHEDDRGDNSTATNCDYYAKKPTGTGTDHFCPSSEDSWVFKIPVQHTGWKLFSCKYSDLLPSEDFANGGFGNRKLEPQKVCRVQLGMVSSPPFNTVSIDLDFACFTYGAPFDPKK
ncbi:MAG: hypothetical protein ACTHJT_01280 [Cytophaga sp.]|uniref:hypothetical protein n=1 Tax=Cytophaga sp. TaxID=29535 RepID=UPI003F80C65A